MKRQNNTDKTKKGFTLIELMLAVAFLGTLLLSVAMLAMRLVDMYTKGATMRAVNSVGGAIVDDVRSHVTSSSLWAENLEDVIDKSELEGNQRRYYRYHNRTINPGTADEEEIVDYGAFCTNSYTYVFNYQVAMLKYRNGEAGEDDYIKVGTNEAESRPYALVRIKDTGCEKFKYLGMEEDEFNALPDEKKSGEYDTNAYLQKNAEGRFIKVSKNDMTVLLDGSTSDEGTDLQIYDFAVMSATQSDATNQVLYDIAFVLGTTRGGIDVKSSNNYCTKQSKIAENQDIANHGISYCSVNRFDFVVRQTGGK